ncbi:hypothetical protein [Streptomyces sp. NPDC018347]|uniref:PP2C family protein-serine/threonine phosphatase n=1 Tax=Streptomyces sp. NPDC018347 TaxID=3157193 RepID=UPI0033CFC6E7
MLRRPLESTDRGWPFGALILLSTDGHCFDGHRIALAEELARRAATAARNARQYAQRAALARDLQTGLLLPDLPEIPGAEPAAFYHPAGEGLEIGGDFYDVFARGDGSWAFILGDVCGRGATAATTHRAGPAHRPRRRPPCSTTRSTSSRPSTRR